MDSLDSLSLTTKGGEELKHRTHKLGMKKRSLLILLEKPQTVEHLLKKTVLHGDDFLQEIGELIGEGFIAVNDASVTGSTDLAANPPPRPIPSSAPTPTTTQSANPQGIHIDEEIVLSEAKFLLIDFCVDCFGTGSQSYVDEIRACTRVPEFSTSFFRVFAAAEKQSPQHLPKLLDLVREINETA